MQRSDWQIPPSEQTVTLVELRNLVTRSGKKRNWKVLNLCLVSITRSFIAELDVSRGGLLLLATSKANLVNGTSKE